MTIEQWQGIESTRPVRRIREKIKIITEAKANRRNDYVGKIFTVESYPRTYETVRGHAPIFNAALGPFSDIALVAEGVFAYLVKQVADCNLLKNTFRIDSKDVYVDPRDGEASLN